MDGAVDEFDQRPQHALRRQRRKTVGIRGVL